MDQVVVGGIYHHFKGGLYIVDNVALHHEDQTKWVVYHSYDTNVLYVRPLDMFVSEVDKEKYPDVLQKQRFKLIGKAL